MKGQWGLVVGMAVLSVLCALCGLFDPLISLIETFGFGWFGFLSRVGPTIEWDPFGWFVALAAFALTVFGVHRVVSFRVSSWPWSRSLAAVALAILACVASISLVGAVHELGWMATSKQPIVQSYLLVARRSHSAHNLKQLGLAIFAYEDETGFLPVLGPNERGGKVSSGWANLIEPYLVTDAQAGKIDDGESRAPDVFQNPGWYGDNVPSGIVSHYAGNVRLLGRSKLTKLHDITDGTSNTLMVGEIERGFRSWRDASNLRDPALGIRPGNDTFCGPWRSKGAAQFLMADGAVKLLSRDVDPKVLKALATPDSGDDELLKGDWEK